MSHGTRFHFPREAIVIIIISEQGDFKMNINILQDIKKIVKSPYVIGMLLIKISFDFNPSRVILCLEVTESRSLYVHHAGL